MLNWFSCCAPKRVFYTRCNLFNLIVSPDGRTGGPTEHKHLIIVCGRPKGGLPNSRHQAHFNTMCPWNALCGDEREFWQSSCHCVAPNTVGAVVEYCAIYTRGASHCIRISFSLFSNIVYVLCENFDVNVNMWYMRLLFVWWRTGRRIVAEAVT